MKFISWNVNGLRAVIAKGGFLEYLEESNADIFCLQEIKLQEGQIDLNVEDIIHTELCCEKGYSGTAIFSKKEPLSVTYGLGIEEHDQEGRVITLEFEDFTSLRYIHQIQNED